MRAFERLCPLCQPAASEGVNENGPIIENSQDYGEEEEEEASTGHRIRTLRAWAALRGADKAGATDRLRALAEAEDVDTAGGGIDVQLAAANAAFAVCGCLDLLACGTWLSQFNNTHH